MPRATPLSLEAFQAAFNPVLADYLAAQTAAARRLDRRYGELAAELSALVLRGGKRLRPYLMWLGYAGLGGPGGDRNGAAETAIGGDILQAAVGLELYHHAWLAHDDLIDHDLVRHGGPNLAGRYRTKLTRRPATQAAHWADAMALLGGDLSLTLAHQALATAAFPPQRTLAAIRRLQATSFQLIGGETLDLLAATRPARPLTPEQLLRVAYLKTAVYTVEAPLTIGAILAGAPANQTARLAAFAAPLGIAFQITDDLLGLFGAEAVIGKPPLSDVREGKLTIPLLYALQLSSPTERQQLRRALSRRATTDSTSASLADVPAIVAASGARSQTEALAHRHVDQALGALPALGFTPGVQQALEAVTHFITHRPF